MLFTNLAHRAPAQLFCTEFLPSVLATLSLLHLILIISKVPFNSHWLGIIKIN